MSRLVKMRHQGMDVVIHCTRIKWQFLTTPTMMTETKQVPEIFNSDPATKWLTAHKQFIHESLEYYI
jgi:hypothetical protein